MRAPSLLFALLCGLTGVSVPAHAFNVDDCILENMRGVTGDVAARAVVATCRNKAAALKAKAVEARKTEFGEELDPAFFARTGELGPSRHGMQTARFTNNSENVITYVRLMVTEATGKECTRIDLFLAEHPAFVLRVPPGGTVVLNLPGSTKLDSWFCLSTDLVYGRPKKLTDRFAPAMKEPVEPTMPDPLLP